MQNREKASILIFKFTSIVIEIIHLYIIIQKFIYILGCPENSCRF